VDLGRNTRARRSTAVRFGIGAIREKAQRWSVHPRRDAIGRWPDLAIANDGPWKRPAGDLGRQISVLR